MSSVSTFNHAVHAALKTHPCVGAAVCYFDGEHREEQYLGAERSDSQLRTGPETLFAYGSFTKVLTAFMVCQLAAEGKLELSDRLDRHLPLGERSPLAGVTIEQLLTHTAGIGDHWCYSNDHAATLALAESMTPIAPPGRLFSYSNLGYAILGHLIEHLSGLSWYENLQLRMLAPLQREGEAVPAQDAQIMAGLGHNTHDATASPVPGAPWPDVGRGFDAAGGTLIGNIGAATDLAYLCLTGCLPGKRAEKSRLLPSSFVARMTQAAVPVPGKGLLAGGWAGGWSTAAVPGNDNRIVKHMGGTSVIVSACPVRQTVVAVLTNSSTGAMFGKLVADQLLGVASPQPATVGSQGMASEFARYSGHYRSATLDVHVSSAEENIAMSDPLGRGESLHMAYLGDATFKVNLGFLDADIAFIADDEANIAYAHIALRALPRQAN
jgi:CubicO group peptidase (beta-lactamase class C family)